MALNQLLHSVLNRSFDMFSDNIAIRTDDREVTYEQLNIMSDIIAEDLINKGINVGDVIAVYLNKSAAMIACLLGIIKAGGVYLPLDTSFPEERLKYMLDNAHTKGIIDDIQDKAFPVNHDLLNIDLNRINWHQAVSFEPPTFDDSNPCYVIYTSGSTGRPKGVLVSHRTVVGYLRWMQEAFSLQSTDVVLAQTTFSFDVSVWEMFWPLCVGASCAVIADEKKYDPQQLAAFMLDHDVSVAQFVPTALHTIADAEVFQRCVLLRHLFSGGEALDQALVAQLSQQTSATIHNLYGPTEATIFCFHWIAQPNKRSGYVPIGKPIPQAKAYVLDEKGLPVPQGQTGELYLAGDILAKGYINNQSMTDARFVDNPFIDAFFIEKRMYQTGDRVRQHEDGVMEYLGRMDRQVKIRGHRIELSEIESVIFNLNEIKNVAVSYEDSNENDRGSKLNKKELKAYYTLKDGAELNAQEIKDYLSQYLPFYMCPSQFIALEKMPTLNNAKTDYSQLAVVKKIIAKIKREYIMPISKNSIKNDVESKITSIWKQILNKESISLNDNFFDVGGNSLLMAKVHRQIKTNIAEHVSIMDLLQYPTIKKISQYIDKR
ncbi:non-ribosomal peptide synthetase [Shewanella surugensis]|uniref:Non-ribosomal peptide synthetase n=1 Tax=Shewanella surugensis TaxID=212020 RepID=A0ABT0L772_9GAMM|nr:non-ribosomal peptide synthetase [Shewanella surugensis]MCL1123235.1 non-ribosomal peptide synthetase [Shewanella surugensis]